jgi:class 3 adenylate cyclase
MPVSKNEPPDEDRRASTQWANLLKRVTSASLRASILPGQSLLADSLSSDFERFSHQLELQKELATLRAQLESQLKAERNTVKQQAEQLAAVNRSLEEIQRKEELAFLLERVSPLAHNVLLSASPLRDRFFDAKECPTFVISMDIRRSTELMLKARSPDHFATFMTKLCGELEALIKEEMGVVDKFTGDGLLASFPEFFSGPDAAYRVVRTSDRAHKIFAQRYREHRSSFTTVLTDVGLGIGIDFGHARFIRVAGGLTVVGTPVVYACRMGSAPAGETFLNQPAYEKIAANANDLCFITEKELEVKHEGQVLAYQVRLTNSARVPVSPSWLNGPESDPAPAPEKAIA